MSELDPEHVRARLDALSRLYRPMTLEEARGIESGCPPTDMSAAAVQARLDELSALWRLTLWLQSGELQSEIP